MASDMGEPGGVVPPLAAMSMPPPGGEGAGGADMGEADGAVPPLAVPDCAVWAAMGALWLPTEDVTDWEATSGVPESLARGADAWPIPPIPRGSPETAANG